MKQIFNYASIVLLVAIASFFFGIALTSISFLLVALCTLLMVGNALKKKKLKEHLSNALILLLLFYGYILLRESFYGLDNLKNVGLKYLPFLVFPVFFCLLSITSELKRKIATVYIYSALLSAFVNVLYAIYRGAILPEKVNLWYFTYNFLAEPFSLQPIYLALFYVFALLLIVDRLKTKKFYWFIFGFLLVNLFLLSARNAIITALLLIPAYLLVNTKFSKKTLAGFFILVVATFAIAIQTPVVKNRISRATKKGNFFSGTSLRYNIWASAVEASNNNLVFGSGKQQGRVLLVEEFKKRNLKTPVKYDYHAHNQFLAFLIEYGLCGLFIFVVLLAQLGYVFLKSREYLGFFWLLMIVFGFITESILTRQWGIIYFALFASFFWNSVWSKKLITKKELDR